MATTEEPILSTDPSPADMSPAKKDKPTEKKKKKPTVAKTKKVPAPKKTNATHPSYFSMVEEAISTLKERMGSSQYAIQKFNEDKHKDLPSNFRKLLLVQIKKFVANGKLVKVKNSYKLPPRSSSAPVKKTVTVAKPKTKTSSTVTKKAAEKPKASAKRKAPEKAVKKPVAKAVKTSVKSTPSKSAKPVKKAVVKKVVKKAPAKKVTVKPKTVKSPAKKVAAKRGKK